MLGQLKNTTNQGKGRDKPSHQAKACQLLSTPLLS